MNDGDEYFYDKLDWVRVRVEDEHWHDLTPVAPSARGTESAAERKSPYSITVGHAFYFQFSRLTFIGFNDTGRTRASPMVVALKRIAMPYETYSSIWIWKSDQLQWSLTGKHAVLASVIALVSLGY